jgi:hypothetical protein
MESRTKINILNNQEIQSESILNSALNSVQVLKQFLKLNQYF